MLQSETCCRVYRRVRRCQYFARSDLLNVIVVIDVTSLQQWILVFGYAT